MTPLPSSPSAGCAALKRVGGSLGAAGDGEGSRALSSAAPSCSWLGGGDAGGGGSARSTAPAVFASAEEGGGETGAGASLVVLRSSVVGRSKAPVSFFGGSTRGAASG